MHLGGSHFSALIHCKFGIKGATKAGHGKDRLTNSIWLVPVNVKNATSAPSNWGRKWPASKQKTWNYCILYRRSWYFMHQNDEINFQNLMTPAPSFTDIQSPTQSVSAFVSTASVSNFTNIRHTFANSAQNGILCEQVIKWQVRMFNSSRWLSWLFHAFLLWVYTAILIPMRIQKYWIKLTIMYCI